MGASSMASWRSRPAARWTARSARSGARGALLVRPASSLRPSRCPWRRCRAAARKPPRAKLALEFSCGQGFGGKRVADTLGLVLEGAEIADDAGRTIRLARLADIPPVQDQPMMRMLPVF